MRMYNKNVHFPSPSAEVDKGQGSKTGRSTSDESAIGLVSVQESSLGMIIQVKKVRSTIGIRNTHYHDTSNRSMIVPPSQEKNMNPPNNVDDNINKCHEESEAYARCSTDVSQLLGCKNCNRIPWKKYPTNKTPIALVSAGSIIRRMLNETTPTSILGYNLIIVIFEGTRTSTIGKIRNA